MGMNLAVKLFIFMVLGSRIVSMTQASSGVKRAEADNEKTMNFSYMVSQIKEIQKQLLRHTRELVMIEKSSLTLKRVQDHITQLEQRINQQQRASKATVSVNQVDDNNQVMSALKKIQDDFAIMSKEVIAQRVVLDTLVTTLKLLRQK